MGNFLSLSQVHFVLPILFALTLALDSAVLHGNVALSIIVPSTEKWYSGFPRKLSVFPKTCFEAKVMKTFKISSDYYKTMPIS